MGSRGEAPPDAQAAGTGRLLGECKRILTEVFRNVKEIGWRFIDRCLILQVGSGMEQNGINDIAARSEKHVQRGAQRSRGRKIWRETKRQ